jgi:serine/threonine protein kinase
MSPEQARGESVGHSSDLFSFGSLLFAMLAGKPPFHAADPMATLNRICHQRHASLADLQPELPIQVSRLVDSLLAKSPHRRPASAFDVRNRLQEFARGKLHVVTLPQLKRRRRLLAVAAILLCVLATWSVWTVGLLDQSLAILGVIDQRPNSPSGNAGQSSDPDPDFASQQASTAGFAELEQLDQRIEQTEREAELMMLKYVAPSPLNTSVQPSPFAQSDSQMQQINNELHQLQQELSKP